MAFVTFSQHSNLSRRLAAPFRALGNFFVLLAEAGPRAEALRRLNSMSDEQLAARNTAREAEVRRIIGANAYM